MSEANQHTRGPRGNTMNDATANRRFLTENYGVLCARLEHMTSHSLCCVAWARSRGCVQCITLDHAVQLSQCRNHPCAVLVCAPKESIMFEFDFSYNGKFVPKNKANSKRALKIVVIHAHATMAGLCPCTISFVIYDSARFRG